MGGERSGTDSNQDQENSGSGLPQSLHSRQSLSQMHMEVQEGQPRLDQRDIPVPVIPLGKIEASLSIPNTNPKYPKPVGSKRRASGSNEGSSLGIDIQLLASTDKIMNTERDVSKERLSPPGSDAGSSFRQSQHGDKGQLPMIVTEFTGGDAKDPIRKVQKTSKKDGGDKGSVSSILTPMFRDKEEKEQH